MKRLFSIVAICLITKVSYAQFFDSTTGLLQMPTATMEPSGTFMITNNYLNWHTLHPRYWGYYNTFAYGFDITFFSRLEIAYVCTIIDGKRVENPSERSKIMFNQDRHFSVKAQLLKEGEIFSWTPSIAVGACDPLSGTDSGYREQSAEGSGSGFFNRYYVVASKHFDTKIGTIGAHLGYQYTGRVIMNYNSPALAVDWKPIWVTQWESPIINDIDIIAEYDGRTINTGLITTLFNNHFDVMLELNALLHFMAGIRFKMVLKS